MEERIARILSFLFHPLLLPLYTLILFCTLENSLSLLLPFKSELILILVMVFITILLPVTLTALFVRMKLVTSFYLETREERIYPLLITGIFYYLAYYLLKGIHLSPVISMYMLGSTLLVVLAMMITFFRKISLHMIGMGGLTGLFLGYSDHFRGGMPILFFVVLLAGIIGSARLKLGAHKSSEIYSGFFLGAIVMFVLFVLV